MHSAEGSPVKHLILASLLFALLACADAAGPAETIEIEAGPIHVLPVDTTVEWSVTGAPSEVVTWSSDDEDIATVSDGVISTLAAGVTTIRAAAADGMDAVELRVEPRARGLLVVQDLGPQAEGPWTRIEYYDLASGETSTVAERHGVDFAAARYSPDGSRIAVSVRVSQEHPNFILRTDIVVMAADGSAEQQLTTASDHQHFDSPTWSPDGSEIAFIRSEGSEGSFSRSGHRIGIMSADGNDMRFVASATSPRESLVWSPDGKYLLIGRVPYTKTIAWLDPEGGTVHSVREPLHPDCEEDLPPGISCNAVESVDWTPDGNLLLVWYGPAGKGAYVLDLQTRVVTPVAVEGNAAQARMAPDGSGSAVLHHSRYQAGIRIFDLEGNLLAEPVSGYRTWVDWRPGAR